MRWILLFGLVPLLACSGILGPPVITAFDVHDGSCGTWSADLSVANARGSTIVITDDGNVVGTWPDVWGVATIHAEGPAASGDGVAGDPVEISARIQGGPEQTVPFRSAAPSFALVSTRPAFQPGASPRFELRLDERCRTDGLRYKAATESWDGEGAVSGGVTAITMPPQPEGTHLLQVEVLSDHGSLGTTQTRFAVGEPDRIDADGDGYPAGEDCDDNDPTVHPGALERPDPNGKDDNCDGRVDEGTVAYDDDGDGLSENQGDCDDKDPLVHPGARELPDCRDNDCDGQIDEGVTLGSTDDRYERPGGAPFVFEGTPRSFEHELTFVSRNRDDDEAVRFWSDDGDWDDWGIDVTGTRVPADSEYDVDIVRVDVGVVASGTLRADGDVVRATGRAFSNDSGLYEVHLRPRRLYAPYCPIDLSIESR